MVWLRDISIKRKLTLTVALLLVFGGFVTYEMVTFRHTMARDLFTLADIIANRSTAALSFDNQEDAEEDLNCLRANKRIVAACLYRGDRVFAQYPKHPGATVFPKPENDTARFEGDHLLLFRHIFQNGERVGTLYLKSDLREMHQRLELYAGTFALFMLASLAVTFVLSSRLQGIITRPIFHLGQTAKIVSMGKNYSVRAQKHADDELGQLIDGFNEMLGQIQQRDVALRDANDQLEQRVGERTRDLKLEIVERKRAEAALQEQLARIKLLNRITQIISERQDVDSILHVVLRQLEDHLTVDFGSICLFEPQAESLNFAALRVKNPLLGAKLDLHEGTAMPISDMGLVPCKGGQTVYMADTLKMASELAERFAYAGLRSSATVPLMVENKLFGVLTVARLRADGFTSGECEFLRTLSEHVALAAHQAQLHRALEKAYNDLRQTQQTVMQQERLKALGQMASGIAHDINNALSPVVGFADLLLRGEPGVSTNGKRYLTHIKTAGEDIAHIVSRLKEFYRRRDEREPLLPLDLNHLAQQVIEMTRPRWRDIPQGRGIMIEVQTDFAAGMPKLAGIESELREALTNLVLNAVDAIPKGGKITLRTRLADYDHVAGNSLPAHAILEVSDTGIGMDAETRKHCLEPFFSTKGKRGTGLGLAMVYGVVERHEGKIEIESEPGQGTTMRLIFPLRRALSVEDLDSAGSLVLAPHKILCIDDEPLLRELLKEILERDGHEVEVSDGGQAGLDAFRAAHRRGNPFDVIITDLGMPYVDGRQVARTVKLESPRTPIILLTGWGAFMNEDGEAPAQVDTVLSKPPRSRELREALNRIGRKPGGEVMAQ